MTRRHTVPATMAARHAPGDALDDFPTPPWAVRALLKSHPSISGRVWDPACGRGDLLRTVVEEPQMAGHGDAIELGPHGSDIHDYGMGYQVLDFLSGDAPYQVFLHGANDWLITNPPFNRAEAFARQALGIATHGVALLCRLQWMEGRKRYGLFRDYPPTVIMPFSSRVHMTQGRLQRQTGSAMAFAWYVWDRDAGSADTVLRWIPPEMKRACERDSDYG